MNLNKVFLLGNLTSEPELKNLPSGQSVCTFGVATNRVWTNKETGQKQQAAEFHNIVAWRHLANIAAQYLKKGGLVFVEGRLTTRSWDDASGVKKYKTEIVADNIQLGPRNSSPPTATAAFPKTEPKEEIPTIEEGEDINIDEVPF